MSDAKTTEGADGARAPESGTEGAEGTRTPQSRETAGDGADGPQPKDEPRRAVVLGGRVYVEDPSLEAPKGDGTGQQRDDAGRFKGRETQPPGTGPGFSPGSPGKPAGASEGALTREIVRGMSAEDINKNWDRVQSWLKESGGA